jgi:hypothetical protein
VKPELTGEQLHVLQHSLGLDGYGQGNAYRNHFCADDNGHDHKTCSALVEMGLMQSHGERAWLGGMTTFSVTEAGREAVTAQSPKRPRSSRSKKRYLHWLRSGVDMTFGDWLKNGGAAL